MFAQIQFCIFEMFCFVCILIFDTSVIKFGCNFCIKNIESIVTLLANQQITLLETYCGVVKPQAV